MRRRVVYDHDLAELERWQVDSPAVGLKDFAGGAGKGYSPAAKLLDYERR